LVLSVLLVLWVQARQGLLRGPLVLSDLWLRLVLLAL
jgi:hypothetical protein